jgi:hypothetical protein
LTLEKCEWEDVGNTEDVDDEKGLDIDQIYIMPENCSVGFMIGNPRSILNRGLFLQSIHVVSQTWDTTELRCQSRNVFILL